MTRSSAAAVADKQSNVVSLKNNDAGFLAIISIFVLTQPPFTNMTTLSFVPNSLQSRTHAFRAAALIS